MRRIGDRWEGGSKMIPKNWISLMNGPKSKTFQTRDEQDRILHYQVPEKQPRACCQVFFQSAAEEKNKCW